MLRESGVPVTEFRAPVIVGSGSLSFEIIRYLTERLPKTGVTVTRIGFGLPSGGGVLYADAVTLKSSLDGRRRYT